MLVTHSGGKLWRFKFRVAGKEKLPTLDQYPEITLRCSNSRSRCPQGTGKRERPHRRRSSNQHGLLFISRRGKANFGHAVIGMNHKPRSHPSPRSLMSAQNNCEAALDNPSDHYRHLNEKSSPSKNRILWQYIRFLDCLNDLGLHRAVAHLCLQSIPWRCTGSRLSRTPPLLDISLSTHQ